MVRSEKPLPLVNNKQRTGVRRTLRTPLQTERARKPWIDLLNMQSLKATAYAEKNGICWMFTQERSPFI